MIKRFVASTSALIAVLTFSILAHAQQQEVRQPGAVYDADVKDQKPVPAPNLASEPARAIEGFQGR